MAQEENRSEEVKGKHVWKVITIFVLLLLAIQIVVAFFGIGINFLTRAIHASENVRVFIGSTISRGGMIAASLLLTIPAITKFLNKSGKDCLYPLAPDWKKDLLAGIGISFSAMTIIFLVELALGWLSVDSLAFKSLSWIVILRTIWLALLVNLTAAVDEEVIFRGFLVTGLKDAWDTNGALLISSIIFGGMHILSAGASETNWLHFIPMLALPGLMLAWAYTRTGNLWLATGLHFAWNFFQDDIYNLCARTISETLIGFNTTQSGPAWFMGSLFGIEVGLAGVLALAFAVAGIWIYTQRKTS